MFYENLSESFRIKFFGPIKANIFILSWLLKLIFYFYSYIIISNVNVFPKLIILIS